MVNRYEAIRARRLREAKLKEGDKWKEILALIRGHPETRVMGREQLLPAYSFVERMFPAVAPAIRSMVVYKNDNTAFCRRIGIPKEAGGAFLVRASAILICYTGLMSAPVPDDVVVVHEMLHYVAQLMGSRFTSSVSEEDFAYAKAIPYLLEQGAKEDWIRQRYLLPYYWSLEMLKCIREQHGPVQESLYKELARKVALERCEMMIRQEKDGSVVDEERVPMSRFEMIG